MSQKGNYTLFAVFPLIDLFFQLQPVGSWSLIMHAAICGSFIYYVIKKMRTNPIMSVVMTVLAVIYNPFRPFPLSVPAWVVMDIVTMALFYSLALKTPLEKAKETEESAKNTPSDEK